MGGSVIMLGLFRGYDGILRRLPSPYSGAKILAGASAGEILFYDPDDKLDPAQYKGCVVHPIDDKKWGEAMERLMRLEGMFALGFSGGKQSSYRAHRRSNADPHPGHL